MGDNLKSDKPEARKDIRPIIDKRNNVRITIRLWDYGSRNSEKFKNIRVDGRMREIVKWFSKHSFFDTVMCCSGHSKYHPTLLVRGNNHVYEIFSGIKYPFERKRFYKQDDEGLFYIPEAEATYVK